MDHDEIKRQRYKEASEIAVEFEDIARGKQVVSVLYAIGVLIATLEKDYPDKASHEQILEVIEHGYKVGMESMEE